jgi:hypothetical protein
MARSVASILPAIPRTTEGAKVSGHIFAVASQPATRFVDRNGPKPMWFRIKPRSHRWAHCCRKPRWAKFLRVQVYYDGVYFWCSPGRGCNGGGK